MSNNTEALTATDSEALAVMPSGEWFAAVHLPINRHQYRCERLEARGMLESRVTGDYPNLCREYRKLPLVIEPCPRCGSRSSRPNGEHYCHPSRKPEASND